MMMRTVERDGEHDEPEVQQTRSFTATDAVPRDQIFQRISFRSFAANMSTRNLFGGLITAIMPHNLQDLSLDPYVWSFSTVLSNS
jgi:hypothetical protein